ncbi:unnamed protein product [Cyclocybe aegerita]|uniref:Uncharacterized protein n=1 Tax=Cyclocybe aegerita TaxID=1973307 RepID=A0A8S0W2Z1_CYCAE|nr:unnamed protein product [Cyclocybe aegerita]
MPRPRPLTHVPPYHPDQQLTPRTPHSASGSRTSRAEQGFAKLQISEAEANELDFDDHHDAALQSAPLLASSSTARFSVHHSRGRRSPITKENRERRARTSSEVLSLAVSRLPLALGIFLAVILLILIVLSFTRPETLHRYVVKGPYHSSSAAAVPTNTPIAQPASSHTHSEANTHLLSYANYTTFPLHPDEYLVECAKMHQGYMAHGDYWEISPMGIMDVQHPEQDEIDAICSSTITYMLDGTAGLAADLALMAQAAALARERNRTFFVDDTYWNRGKWTDHFEDVRAQQLGPQPGCRAPPPDELVACPRTARHWVINSRTAKFHFSHAFSNHYEDPFGHELNRLKPIFESALHSFGSTIIPNAKNMELIHLARTELASFIRDIDSRLGVSGSPYLSVHIRRGDRKTLSYTFPDRKIPLEDYLTALKSTWSRLHPQEKDAFPVVYLATDSPEAHRQFSEKNEGETFSLHEAANSRLRDLASPGEYYQSWFNDLGLQSRIIATRGVVVDLALISGLWPERNVHSPDAVICAMSSTICTLSAVGLGWDRAFGEIDKMGNPDKEGERWVDVDQKGRIIPVWAAFQLF